LRQALEKTPLELARSGRCVRSITACPGTYCKFSEIDTQQLAANLFERFGNKNNLPHKFKIAVCGCSHCCSKPQENDLGVMGEGKNYVIFVGGMAGKTPRWGNRFPFVIRNKTILLRFADATIQWYVKYGGEKERFGTTIERVGFPKFVAELEKLIKELKSSIIF
jgi:dissimilatory sulfite reductase (desulfoviridin) alpha/beta subunit